MKKWSFFFIMFITFKTSVFSQTYNMSNNTYTTCSGTFYDSGGNAANYSHNENLTLTFSPSTVGQYMSVNFTSFSVELNYDYLYVYDGNSTAAPLIARFSGTTSPGIVTASSANASGSLTFKFTSNGSVRSTGWVATISCGSSGTPSYAMDNVTLSVCSGNFYDSGGNLTYMNNENFTMTFCPSTPGQYISISFTSFDVEANYDTLYAYDGSSTSAPLIGKFSGTVLPGTLKASSANASGCLTFKFVSDNSTRKAGWVATISCGTSGTPLYAMNNATITTCSGDFYDTGGSTYSYYSNENSTMTFCPSTPGSCIELNFSPITIELNYDSLIIYDGNSSASPVMAMINENAPSQIFLANASNPSGCITVRFFSDGGNNFPGWAAAISCKTCDNTNYLVNINGNASISSGKFYDVGGLNANYLNNANIVQTLCSNNPSEKFVSFQFTSFNTEIYVDNLDVYDGTSTSDALLGTYSGNLSPFSVNATKYNSSGCLTTRFTSDPGNSNSGWRADIITTAVSLPIELISFTGKRNKDNVLLEWTTASEMNNDFFTIERTTDFNNWESIAQVHGAGNSFAAVNYTAYDINPLQEVVSYYRLKQTDFDGKYKYSNVITIQPQPKTESKEDELILLSNFIDDNFIKLRYCCSQKRDNVNIEVYNLLGQQIISETLSLIDASKEIKLHIDELLHNGVYLLKIQGEGVKDKVCEFVVNR